MHRLTLSVAAFTAAAAGGAGLGFLWERRAISGDVPADPEGAELRRGIPRRPRTVESYDGTSLHVEELGEAGAPVIVFTHGYGLSQQAWYPSAARRLRDALPCAQVVEPPGAGHMAMARLEAHAAVSATICGWAERLLRPNPRSSTGRGKAGRG